MIEIAVPGFQKLRLAHLVLDYNGTMAVDGTLIYGVEEKLKALSEQLTIHVITADTFGKVSAALKGIPCRLSILPPGQQDSAKQNYVEQLGPQQTVCIGNGRNDRLMLKAAALGIAVIQDEGAAIETLLAADVAAPNIVAALNLLAHPLRLIATLRV